MPTFSRGQPLTSKRTRAFVALGCAAHFCFWLGAALAQPPGTPLPEGIRGGSELVPEPHVEILTYRFEETGEELPYSLFVSSKVKRGDKAPLIIALRGYTGTTLTFVRGTTIDLAEQGGYILVGPIGYNNRAGFGVGAAPRPDLPMRERIKDAHTTVSEGHLRARWPRVGRGAQPAGAQSRPA